jgi:cytochrome c551/c552
MAMRWPAAKLAIAIALVAIAAAGTLVYRAIADASERRQRAILLTGGDPTRAPGYMRQYGCAGCHTIAGAAGANGLVGPPLQSITARVYVGGASQLAGSG